MNSILNWFTKKKILVVSLFFILLIPFLAYLAEVSTSFLLERYYESFIYFLFIFIPIFILSIINLYIKDSIFYAWKKSTLIYILVYLLLIIIAPARCDYLPLCEEFILIYLVPLYFIFSLVFIFYKSLNTK